MVDGNIFQKYCTAETWKKIVDYPSVSAMWKHCLSAYGDKEAVVDGEEHFSFNRLENEVALFRGVLTFSGITKGDNVGIYCPNSDLFIKAFLAVTTMGCCAVLLPPQLPDVAVLGCSVKFNLKALVYDKSLEANLETLKTKRPDLTLVDVATQGDTKACALDSDAKTPCAVVFTGGTTGKSKGALLSNGAIMRGVKNGCYGVHDVFEQRYIQVLPMTHVFGLIRNMLCSLYTGSSLCICRNNKDMFRDIELHKPTVMVMVPALAELALNLSKQFGKNMLGSSMKTIIAGAAVVAPYLVREYDKLGIKLFPGYGLTESANLVSGNPEPLSKSSSVGFVYPDMEVKIVDGELWLKGPNMFDCYMNEPEENKNAFEDGWFKTGDLVRFDKEGFLYITGRKKEVIVLSTGENISPAEIETKFNELDCVQDSLVYASEDKGNEVLAVQVLPRLSVLKANNIEDIGSYVKQKINEVNAKLPSSQRVSKIIIRDQDFVRSPSMKIVRGKNGEK